MNAKHLFWALPLLALAAYVIALVSFGSEPKGMVASYDMFPHSTGDVLEFSGGTVMHRSCCGDDSWGTYSSTESGDWIWDAPNNPIPAKFHIEPGVFSMTFTVIDKPNMRITLRRRLSAKLPF